MSSNKKDNNGWILCPSKSFPGKFYYFNVLNGETAWSLNDADQKSFRKDNVLQKADKSHSYPEPSSPPSESPITNIGSIHRTIINTPQPTYPNVPPVFGQATFPTYISNVEPNMQTIIWTPIQLPVFAKPRRDQVTQTWEPEKEIFVQTCSIPLSKRFTNYEEPNTSIFSKIAHYSQNKYDLPKVPNNFYENQIDKPGTTTHIFGQASVFRQNKQNVSNYKMANIFCISESNKSNIQLFEPKAPFQNNTIKEIDRHRTQSESDRRVEEIENNIQKYEVTNTQMLDQTKIIKNTEDNFLSTVRRQRIQSESDSIIFQRPNDYDSLKSSLITSNKANNYMPQNLPSSKPEESNFVLRKSVLNLNNKEHTTSSQVKSTGQHKKEIRNDSLWYKQDIKSLEDNQRDYLVGNQEKSKNDNEKGDLLNKLDKNDLRYTLEMKRRKSIDMGIPSHSEENKFKTPNLNAKQKETPKKRVTFDLDSETSVDELNECDEIPQYVNIHTLRRLADHVAEYWYIAVDTNVLLEDFEFIDKFVQLDNKCRLLIPHAVQSQMEAFCFGDCRGQQRVIVARQVVRRLASPPPHIVVQPLENEDAVVTNMSTLGRILNCCLQIIEHNDHVVLITNDSVLCEKAKSLKIHCYKLKEIKDGASRPEMPNPEPIKITLKNDTTKNLFLQKDFVSTWKIPIDTSEKIFTKENTLKHCDIQTNMPPTTDANTSPINFDETIDKNNRKTNLNFDYGSNSDTSDISKTMQKLFIKDNNSNFVKKSTTKDINKLEDREHNSFTFQIKNKNILQQQNVKSNQLQNLKDKSNPFQSSIEKSNNSQSSKKESIFSVLNDPLKNVKFQIQNNMPQKQALPQKKNVGFQIQTNEKEIQRVPYSNNNNRQTMQEKYRNSIREKLKDRFQVTSNLMEENIRSNIEEWICSFMQVMENGLSALLQESNLSSLPPPWTLHEAVTCIKQVYSELWAVCVVADELSLLLFNNSNKQGQLKRTMKPEDFMLVFGCGVLLMEHLQATQQMPEDIEESQQLLNDILLTIQNGKQDVDLARSPVLTRSDDEEEGDPKRLNFMKKSSETLQYLKKHFPAWQAVEETTHPTLANDEVVTNNNNDTKIVRTCGRNLNLLTIDKTKSMTMNANESPTKEKEKSSQCTDTNKNSEINISPNAFLSSKNTVRLFERSDESNVVSFFSVTAPLNKNNQDKPNENTESVSQNTTGSTVKLYEEPKIVRLFDASTPFPTKKVSKDSNNPLILLSPKHGNTFGSQEETAGPKVVRNIKLIDAFEEKLKVKVDMDQLDYSEETISTFTITSQGTVFDGNESNNDKASLTDQNNDKQEQNNNRLNISRDNNSFDNHKEDTDGQNYNESNISSNVSFNDDRNNETVQNNDSLKPNDSSTNDSGFVNENDTVTFVQTFLSQLSSSMKLIYKFIEDSMKEFRDKDLQSEKRKKIVDKATSTRGHLTGIIYKLQCIVQREADAVTPLKEIILKADMMVVSDKRMMRYRQVVMKCLEQAEMLDGALRQLLAIADGNYDVTFCSDRSVYFNIFE